MANIEPEHASPQTLCTIVRSFTEYDTPRNCMSAFCGVKNCASVFNDIYINYYKGIEISAYLWRLLDQ